MPGDIMLIALLLACGTSALDDGFEADIAQGYGCGDSFYIGLNASERFRVQIDLDPTEAEIEPGIGLFVVYTGHRLAIRPDGDRCDDVVSGGLFDRPQNIEYVYEAISGRATVLDDGDERSFELESVVLRATNTRLGDWDPGRPDWEDLPDIEMADGPLEFVRRDDL